jgi:hypothetical protein
MTALFGKFRGTVTENQDPEGRGRIRARVPAVTGPEATGWALRCSPAGYSAVPAIGAGVWIEFEQGDQELPIWTGCWSEGDAETVTLRNAAGAGIVLQGPTVSLNNGALEVT